MEIGCYDRRRSVQEVPPITGGVVLKISCKCAILER
jgi:hypothetical protein